MDGNQKAGFMAFRETKAAIPAGITLALIASSLMVAMGFVDMLGGLCIGILAYIILRFFRVRKLEHLMTVAALMLVIFTIEIYMLPWVEVADDANVAGVILNIFVVLVLPFTLIMILVWWMRRNLERTRARLEKEGRLYPPGYGRCKRCGTVVLPGEISCRRCGEYIDVPEEMRVKKVNFFECSECGREVPEDAGVCPFCGEAFDEDGEKKAAQ